VGCGGAAGGGGATKAPLERNDEPIEGVIADLEPGQPEVQIPYVGKMYNLDGVETGLIRFDACGCGYVRSYLEIDSERLDVKVVFPGVPTDFSRFEGESELLRIVGTFYDEGEQAFGETTTTSGNVGRFNITIDREGDQTAGCRICHIENDPFYPLPETHIPVTPVAPNCLECHDTV